MDDFIYTVLRSISVLCGAYFGIFFIRLWYRLPQPPYYRMPFLVLGIVNLCAAFVYTLAVFHYDGFGAISNTGRIIQILLFGYMIMPYVIARSMGRME